MLLSSISTNEMHTKAVKCLFNNFILYMRCDEKIFAYFIKSIHHFAGTKGKKNNYSIMSMHEISEYFSVLSELIMSFKCSVNKDVRPNKRSSRVLN